MKKISFVYAALLLAAACKEKDNISPVPPITAPVIISVSQTFVQAGDTIVIKGEHLKQDTLSTALSISGRPARILKIAADSIQALIPEGTYPGKILLTISRGNSIASVYGPELNVIPVAVISNHFPTYLYGGDTVTLIVRDFSVKNEENSISMDGKPLKLVYNNGKDTLRAVVPADAVSSKFSWSTYGKQTHSGDSTLFVRKKHYNAANLREYIAQDPAFRFMHFGINMPEATNPLTRAEFHYLIPYLDGTKSGTIFITEDSYYLQKGWTSFALYKEKYFGPAQWIISTTALAGILPDFAAPRPLEAGKHKTALNRFIVSGDNTYDVWNEAEINKQGNDFYIRSIHRPSGSFMNAPFKATYLGQVGGSYIYSIGAPLPYDNEYF